METVFTLLFKYPPFLFRQGEVVFRTEGPMALLLGLIFGGAVLAAVSYRAPMGKTTPWERLLLGTLRVGVFALLFLALLRPTLLLRSAVPDRNFVAVLLDDSRSMQLPDLDGRPRGSFVREQFDSEGGPLFRSLDERFNVRFFRFSSSLSRLAYPESLRFQGTRTDLVGALEGVLQEMAGLPLAGVVVVSDGADNRGRPSAEALVRLQAAAVPVFAIGVGEEVISPDLQLRAVTAPRRLLKGTTLLMDVVVGHRGFEGRKVSLSVEDDEGILAQEEVELGKGETTLARVAVTLDRPGLRRLRVWLAPQQGERLAENNERWVEVEVRNRREKILYFEGEPRYEVAFLRRALNGDENLQLVVLQRTAPEKFLRLDVDSPEELLGGFPTSRDELFRYRAVILGSVEASYFTRDQLEMLVDFVGRRGGGLLVLGGRFALAEGGYRGTALEEVLPVILEEPAADPQGVFTAVKVRPSSPGLLHPAVQLRSGTGSPSPWDSLPPLHVMNPLHRLKAGATLLLSGATDRGQRQVVLAFQRYGPGKAVVFPVVDSWMWQFHADIPLEDQTHEIFWRQLLRWLVDGVPEPVVLRLEPEKVEPGEEVRVVAEVKDSVYLPVNDARVRARITAPDGRESVLPLEWNVDRDGEYRGGFVPDEEGVYEVTVEASRGDGPARMGTDAVFLNVGPDAEEYFDAHLRKEVLGRIARETGGRYYPARAASSLAQDIRYSGSGLTVTEEKDLWDMPILFLVMIGLLGLEWGLRRRRGLA